MFGGAGPGGTKMPDLPCSSQLKVSQGNSCMCKEKGLYRARFLPVHAVGGAALLYGRTKKYVLGVWGQRGGFRRVFGDVLSHTDG